LVEFLGLTPVQRRADYRSRVEKAVHDHPEDAAAQLARLKLLLEDGNVESAPALAHRITEMKPGPGVLAEGGRALLAAQQYVPAKEMLTAAATASPPADVGLDLAIANAQVLDAAGQHDDAIAAMRQALAGANLRVDVCWQAAGLLARNRRVPEALQLFDGATDPEMLLMKAVLLELAGQSAAAGNLLSDVQNRRPEWFAVWVARGVMLAAHNQGSESRRALETALALGARSPYVRDLLAGKAAADLSGLFLARPPREW
jgi:tetratricopeptide (TPR) repeat protein